ncbi:MULTISPECIES: hypothetical protein [unclassified Streptomyces]|uniref:hypothetical protein n=1 Tax=unclassified Streptomyces TaxID=2593676 RepID=UPI00081D66F7|nr:MULTISPECIES: hypothetical protein [unclassified Streptomyces]MYR93084.1 hypothetical protein [Streptomyces sp. SID4937]SCD46171.1 hypothetical protein GA0115243_102164 [Streptomyces sp. ScaeMP-e83]
MTKPTAMQRGARTLTHGQRLLLQRLAARAAAWIRAGRRDDLDGIAAVLGCVLRLAVLLAGAAGAVWLIRRWPAVLWLAVPLWCWAAIRAIPDEDEEAPEKHPQAPEATADQREQLLTLVRALIGDHPGVHLSTLLDHLRQHGQGEGWTIALLRTRLPLLGVPVRKSVKVARRVAYGVHRDDLPQPSPAEAQQDAA